MGRHLSLSTSTYPERIGLKGFKIKKYPVQRKKTRRAFE